MSEHEDNGMEVLAGLRNALGTECPKCGEMNPINSKKCEGCGGELPQAEADESLSYLHDEGILRTESAQVEGVPAEGTAAQDEEVKKIPLEKAKNLILLKDAVAQAEAGTIPLQDYQAKVTKVMNIIQTGVNLSKTDVVQNKIASLPDEERILAEDTAAYLEDYLQGCKRMLEYKGGEDGAPAIEGLDMVEKALISLDKIQDRALEIYEERKREKEAAEAEKASAEA
jgi:hypothetical protein